MRSGDLFILTISHFIFLFASSGNTAHTGVWLAGWKVGGGSPKDGVTDVDSMKMAVLKSALWCMRHKEYKFLQFGVFVFDNTHPHFGRIKRAPVATRFPKNMPNFHICKHNMTVSTIGFPFRLFIVSFQHVGDSKPDIREVPLAAAPPGGQFGSGR